MPLAPKIYNAAQKIIKAIHRGKPNLFTDSDLNQHLDILEASADRLWKLAGSDYNSIFVDTSTYSSDTFTLNMNVTWGDFTVFVRAMQFSIPAGNFIAPITGSSYPSVRIYLIAAPTLITFADDPVMSGVSDPSLPTALASSDHLIYKNERIAYAAYPALPVLSSGEEIVAKIATIIPMPAQSGAELLGSTTNNVPRLFSLTNTAYGAKIQALIGDKFGADVSLAEMNQYIMDYLLGYIKEPIGTWKGFYINGGTFPSWPGYLTATSGRFDDTGLGLNRFAGWAMCNGVNFAPDWRGRSPIGHDNRTTNPGNGIWDLNYNVVGAQVGAMQQVITRSNLPAVQIGVPIPTNQTSQGQTGSGKITTGGEADEPVPGPTLLTDPLGSGTPMDMRQASFVSYIIMRIS